jgi:hypothetical protein
MLLPEGQMGGAWETSKKQRSFGNSDVLNRKVFSLSPFLKYSVCLGFNSFYSVPESNGTFNSKIYKVVRSK